MSPTPLQLLRQQRQSCDILVAVLERGHCSLHILVALQSSQSAWFGLSLLSRLLSHLMSHLLSLLLSHLELSDPLAQLARAEQGQSPAGGAE